MDIVLADLVIDGEEVKAILHAPKNGFFYVINRETGKLISAEPFAETTWASHVDPETGRPVEIPGARYEDGPAVVTPMGWGAHSWHAMSYNPQTGLAYLPTIHMALTYTDEGVDLDNWQSVAFEGGTGVESRWAPDDQPREHFGSLQAWDPVRQEAVWSVPQGHFWNAGTLTTAGNLVFQGKPDGHLVAYDARNGDILWTFDAGLGISAPPITYKLNGRQYIALLVGWGGGASMVNTGLGWSYGVHTRRLIAFSLEGTAELPPLPPPHVATPLNDVSFLVDAGLAEEGAALYGQCRSCHGGGAVAGGMAPDLRASTIPLNHAAFASIVRDGARVGRGMPAFPHLSDDELSGLQHFIRRRAMATASEPETTGGE
jgi:quinohemoprotein ethanol dehydrogenase